jgi:uncharacterized protein (TIGR02594 family)
VPGGFFCLGPTDKTGAPVSIRFNNPGAVNGASWERTYPGYVAEQETTPGNRSTIFETPEQGVAVWWDLMRRYRTSGIITVAGIINRYGGGQDYSAYVKQVATWTGLAGDTEIKLYGDDVTLLKFAKAMFRYEAGRVPPWSDEQILFGFGFGRTQVSGVTAPAIPVPVPPTEPPPVPPFEPWWLRLIYAIFGRPGPVAVPPLVFLRILKLGVPKGADVLALQKRLSVIGYTDIVLDGDFGDVTDKAVRDFQSVRNLDPDGEVGFATIAELNAADAHRERPPLLPAPEKKYGKAPPWYVEAEKWIGWKETGNNQGIEKFIAGAKTGHLGDPYCAIWINYDLETTGVQGSRSPAARSFEKNANFVKLMAPALGAIVTMWRGSPTTGQGHVFLYDGENSKGVRGIGANENDEVKRSFHDRQRITGYWWPHGVPLPTQQAIAVSDGTTGTVTSET